MKILHVLSQRPDSTGSGIYLQAMLREAACNGHRNFLVAGIQPGFEARLDCIDADQCRFVRFKGADLPFAIVGMSDVMPYASSRFRDLSPAELDGYENCFAGHLQTAVQTFQPDVIHSHHLWLVTALTRRLFPDIPIVTSCHGSDLRQFRTCPHFQSRVLAGCRGVEAVMALSSAQKRTIVDLYGINPERVHVIGAGYNDALFFRVEKPAPRPVEIVYAGKLSHAKGVPWMLRALSRIDKPDWHLHLVGGGSGKEPAECLQLAKGLGARVTVHGMLPQPRLAELMRASHLFVLPSFYEGLPLVILEALACGCRIVATDLPGVCELLANMQADFISLVATPRLLNVDEPLEADRTRFESDLKEALLRQIRSAVDHPQIDLSGIADRMAGFSWKGIFEKVQALYGAQAT